ncbi:MAG: alpha/beta fold hydrolase [Myxococcales bacterium]|nr:alpha/beta fold hydrolase [Myxococcales bacterium]
MKQVRLTSGSPRISYFLEGEGGAPVLMIMGFGMRGEAWRPQIDGLKARHPVLYFDARGLGDSDPVTGRLSMTEMAEDALRVLDDAGFERAHLVGVSMGGMVAQELALSMQHRFHTLTLIATHAGGPLTWIPKATSMRDLALVTFSDGPGRLERLERLLYPEAYRATCDRGELSQRMRRAFGARPPQATLNAQHQAVMRHRAASRLGQLRLPTLVIRAGQDRMIAPEHTRRLASLIPHARELVLPEAGHGLVFQSAAEINAALLEHFEVAAQASRSETRGRVEPQVTG